MDPRLSVGGLGAAFSDAFVVRNAGGRVTWDVVRSLLIAWRVLDVRELVVVHHTDCRMMTFTDVQLRRATGVGEGTNMDFLTFTHLDPSVIADVDMLRRSPYFGDAIPVSGCVWDLARAELRSVVLDQRSRLAVTSPRRASSAAQGARPAGRTTDNRAAISVPTGGIWRLGGT
jgi:carbonic anhydrase